MSKSPIICLITDFGISDTYAGEMKGVALGICDNCRFVDLTHKIRKFDIRQACYTLSRSYPYFPEGTAFVAVVDPGVGASRRPLAVKSQGRYFVGPDNGIFSFLIRDENVVFRHVTDRSYMREVLSHTFHGRDVFAPVAAYLAMGIPIEELGPTIDDPILLPDIWPEKSKGKIIGKVIHIDDFGNLITNITAEDIEAAFDGDEFSVFIGDELDLGKILLCYEDVAKGKPLALWGSGPFLEIAVREGRADRLLERPLNERVFLMTKKTATY